MQYVTIKTADASGAALDWLVAQCEQVPVFPATTVTGRHFCCIRSDDGFSREYDPTRLWGRAGPMIEKYKLDLLHMGPTKWWAIHGIWETSGEGETPMVAICRAVVATVLGAEVEVPAILVTQ